MPLPTLVIPRAEFSIEEPWEVPPQCRPAELRRATDGSAPRLATSVAAYCDDEVLTILFRAEDDEIVATMYDHDQPLWQEDVVETFLAVDATTYVELEMNPLGTTFDARITSPDGVRATMRADVSWNCDDLFAAMRRALFLALLIPTCALAQTGTWGLRGITRRFVVRADRVFAIDGRGVAVYDASTLRRVDVAETDAESVDAAFAGDTLFVLTRDGFQRF